MPRAPRRRSKLGEPAKENKSPKESKPARTAEVRESARKTRAARKTKKPRKPKKVNRPAAGKLGGRGLKLKRPSLPSLPKDAVFRTSTRFKAVGYGGREQAWKLSRGFEKRVEKPLRSLWSSRSGRTRRIIAGGALLLLLVSVLRYTPFPGVPCSVSGVKECAPSDSTLAMVPSDALLYTHLTLDGDTPQFERLNSIVGGFSPDRTDQLGTALLPRPSGVSISFGKDIRPWAADDAALVITPGESADAASRAFVIGVGDRKGADAFLAKVAPGAGTKEKVGDAELTIRDGSLTSAYRPGDGGDFLVVGGEAAVRKIASIGIKGAKSLEQEPVGTQIRDQLPENRFADLYVSGAGVRQLLVPSVTTAATQLDTFVDYGASKGFSVGAVAESDGVELSVYSLLDPKRQKASPSPFTSLPHFRPELTDDVGARAMGYVGVGKAGETLGSLLQRAGAASPGLATSLQDFGNRLRTEAQVDPVADLLPALGGQAALVAEPTDGIPFASLIVEGVDEVKAKEALAKLQGPVVRALQSPTGTPLPGFQSTSLRGGIEASQLQLSPTVNLTYAVFDGRLVVSTQPAGVEQVADGGGESLEEAGAFAETTQGLPRDVSALVFFNLDELLDLAEALGRTEDPLYVSFRDDIRKLHALAAGVDAGAHDLRSQLFVTID